MRPARLLDPTGQCRLIRHPCVAIAFNFAGGLSACASALEVSSVVLRMISLSIQVIGSMLLPRQSHHMASHGRPEYGLADALGRDFRRASMLHHWQDLRGVTTEYGEFALKSNSICPVLQHTAQNVMIVLGHHWRFIPGNKLLQQLAKGLCTLSAAPSSVNSNETQFLQAIFGNSNGTVASFALLPSATLPSNQKLLMACMKHISASLCQAASQILSAVRIGYALFIRSRVLRRPNVSYSTQTFTNKKHNRNKLHNGCKIGNWTIIMMRMHQCSSSCGSHDVSCLKQHQTAKLYNAHKMTSIQQLTVHGISGTDEMQP